MSFRALAWEGHAHLGAFLQLVEEIVCQASEIVEFERRDMVATFTGPLPSETPTRVDASVHRDIPESVKILRRARFNGFVHDGDAEPVSVGAKGWAIVTGATGSLGAQNVMPWLADSAAAVGVIAVARTMNKLLAMAHTLGSQSRGFGLALCAIDLSDTVAVRRALQGPTRMLGGGRAVVAAIHMARAWAPRCLLYTSPSPRD